MSIGIIRLSVRQGELESENAIQPRARSLLVNLHQRHPQILQNAFQNILNDETLDKNATEQLLLSLSVNLPKPVNGQTSARASKTDNVMATVSADATVRVSAVRALYEQMSTRDCIDIVSFPLTNSIPEVEISF
jgi:U3 small nucleolar RNA-associated protein 10